MYQDSGVPYKILYQNNYEASYFCNMLVIQTLVFFLYKEISGSFIHRNYFLFSNSKMFHCLNRKLLICNFYYKTAHKR